MLIFDAHLDLSMNALEWNRDLTRSIDEIRAREIGQTDKPDRGQGTVCLAEMRRGNVGLCVATLIARYVKPANPLPGFHAPEIAWAHTQGQLAWYRAMEAAGQMVQIRNLDELRRHVQLWQNPPEDAPIGYIASTWEWCKKNGEKLDDWLARLISNDPFVTSDENRSPTASASR